MKINHISLNNYIGARRVEIALRSPICLISGKNGAGKSSTAEGVRHALTGESVRVSLKKDYKQLVSEGAEAGLAVVDYDDSRAAITLPNGAHELTGPTHPHSALPFVLDAQRFAHLVANERRSLLFGLMGLRTDGESITERMLARQCDAKKVEQIAPFLRAGFEAGQKESQGKAREAKASWKTITGGETYGSVKAASFRIEKPEAFPEKLVQDNANLAALENEIEAQTARLGGLQSRARHVAEQAGKLSDLREKAGRFARIQEKLIKDETELKVWEQKIADTRAQASGEDSFPCPCCGVVLIHRIDDGLAIEYVEPEVKADPEAVVNLPEYEKAMKLMESCVANGKRDLYIADVAAQALKDLDDSAEEVPGAEDITALKARIDTMKQSRTSQQAYIRKGEDAGRKACEADEKAARAAALHQDVQQWDAIADALAPDGIPGEMLAEALGPINERLTLSSNSSEWLRIGIEADMTITAEGGRPYALLSDSEKWRADAMIAEAVAHISGIRLLVLDKADVLDLKGREDLFCWLCDLVETGDVETALVFATLKTLPANLPDSVSCFWIENGRIVKLKEAA